MKNRVPGLHRQRHKGHDLWRAYARMRQRGKRHHFVNISWGLGIGIIIDGKVYTGKSGFPENSGMSMFSIMKYCATAAKRMPGNGSLRIGTTPHPVGKNR